MHYLSRVPRWLLAVVLLAATACGSDAELTRNPPENRDAIVAESGGEKLEVLRVAVIPDRSSAEQEQKVKSLENYLEAELSIPVKVQLTKDYETAVDLIAGETVEMAYLGAFTYLKAKAKNPDLEAIAAHIDTRTGRPWYTSVIVADRTAGIRTLEDLRGKRFSFVNRSSTSGFLVPSSEFKEVGIEPESDFAAVEYGGSHDRNVEALAAGEVDAIAVDREAYVNAKESGTLPEERYQMIWESEPIPNPPLVINTRKISGAFKSQLQKTLIASDPNLMAISGSGSSGFTLVQDGDYDSIRKLQRNLNLEQE